MLKKTCQIEKQLRGRPQKLGKRQFRTVGSGLALGLATIALLTACEGTLGPMGDGEGDDVADGVLDGLSDDVGDGVVDG